MPLLRRTMTSMRGEPILLALVLLAFLLRVAGVGYGLPLSVVNDEYPFTYAALQMLQLKTLIPALHPEAFANILPYPPYLSYALLLPFAAIVGVKMLLWSGAADLFIPHLVTDLSTFFVAARLFHVALGAMSVYLVYRIADALFRSKIAASAAAFLLATSLLHQALSMVGRNWLPVSFVFLLVLFILTREVPKWRRYLYAFMIAGIGMGISSVSALAVALIGLYYLCYDAENFRRVVHDAPKMLGGALVFAALAVVPTLLWQGGSAFLAATTLFEEKSLAGVLTAPWSALSLIAFSEPVLVVVAVAGLIFLLIYERRWGVLMSGFFLFYAVTFYLFFRFDARFFVPLIPLYALCGGYAVSRILEATPHGREVSPLRIIVISLLIVIPLTTSARLSYLAYQGDTRAHAREWVLENLGPSDRVLVFSSALHIPTQAAAVRELRAIDEAALRKIDEADEKLDRTDVPYALNGLTSLADREFFDGLPSYAKKHGYAYLVLEERSLAEASAGVGDLARGAEAVARFDGLGIGMSVWESAFLEPLPTLFADKALGPDIVIYRLAP